MDYTKRYTRREDLFNAITHGAGIILSIAGSILLIINSINYGNIWHISASIIFGCSMIFMYSCSTIYHGTINMEKKFRRNILDHVSIFVLNAGSYTPFLIITLRNQKGLIYLAVIWGLAIIGIFLKIFFMDRFRKITAFIYLIMGWFVVFFIGTLINSLPKGGFIWLLLGGIAYSVGVIFYQMKKVKYMHFVFHLFVLLGSLLVFICVYFYVIPMHSP